MTISPERRPETLCPCGRRPYATCCGPLHQGIAHAQTAEDLMRSRYAAFALADVVYLAQTATEPIEDAAALATFCKDTVWLKLQIWNSTETTVRFTAHSLQQGDWVKLNERSEFVQQCDRWLYLSGDAKISKEPLQRNSQCPCDSGKKFKSCHGGRKA